MELCMENKLLVCSNHKREWLSIVPVKKGGQGKPVKFYFQPATIVWCWDVVEFCSEIFKNLPKYYEPSSDYKEMKQNSGS